MARIQELNELVPTLRTLTPEQLHTFTLSLTDPELALLRWYLQRRPEQQPPSPLPPFWFLRGGRGSGKTMTAANHIFEYALAMTPQQVGPQRKIRIALVGETFDDVKKTMVEGETGLLGVIPESLVLAWNRTLGELVVQLPTPFYREIHFNSYTSEKPDKLRGPQFHGAWIDEPAKLKDANLHPDTTGTTWSNLMMGLRLGQHPHVTITGTPTPCQLVLYLQAHPRCVQTVMTSWQNRQNMPQNQIDYLESLQPGSRTYRQEVLAEVLTDNPDALFSEEQIDNNRRPLPDTSTPLLKVLGYDPSASASTEEDEAGIMLCHYTRAVTEQTVLEGKRVTLVKEPTRAYPTHDLSGHYTPKEQTTLVIRTALDYEVDDIIFEQNQGVQFIMDSLEQALKEQVLEYTIRKEKTPRRSDYGSTKRFHVTAIMHDGSIQKFTISAVQASQGKKVRAGMVSARYDSNQVHHPPKETPLPTCPHDNCRQSLELQQTSWSPISSNSSPDRLDALVYALLHIFGSTGKPRGGHATISSPAKLQLAAERSSNLQKAQLRSGNAKMYSVDIMDRGILK